MAEHSQARSNARRKKDESNEYSPFVHDLGWCIVLGLLIFGAIIFGWILA